jgi:ATP-dependent Clp protease ATP-binding subunit ClpC
MNKPLNTGQPEVLKNFEKEFNQIVIGQPDAVRGFAKIFGNISAKACNPNRPKGVVLLLGPTGVGKTKSTRTFSQLTKGSEEQLEVYCDAFVHSSYAASIVGAPAGYVGHETTVPLLCQANIDAQRGENFSTPLILFDEFEKAGEALFRMMLGAMENGRLRLGNNELVDLTDTILVMTSNLGAEQMQSALGKPIGFSVENNDVTGDDIKNLNGIALAAAKRNFSPEFMNRIDEIIVFLPLDQASIKQVLELEIQAVQNQILFGNEPAFLFSCGEQLKAAMFEIGFSKEYGARHMRRTVESMLKPILVNLILGGEINVETDHIYIDLVQGEIVAYIDSNLSGLENVTKRAEFIKQLAVGRKPSILPIITNPRQITEPKLEDYPSLQGLFKAQEMLRNIPYA